MPGARLRVAGLLRPHRPDRVISAAVIDDLGELTFAEVHERTNRLSRGWSARSCA